MPSICRQYSLTHAWDSTRSIFDLLGHMNGAVNALEDTSVKVIHFIKPMNRLR
jgi:hypothetical protein